ncbi:MAG: protein-L-isoaspartate O-methyltransferase family protein [Candidatus Pelagibacterales bacterium]
MEINADNSRMVNGQIKPINGMTEKLVSIFNSLNRESFMPEKFKESAYVEKNLALPNHRVILKPEIVAKIAMFIDLKENENVLILGSTTGYLTAVLSLIAETVIVVEEDDSCIKSSEIATKENNLNNVIYIKKSISNGCIEQSPFNAIIIEGAVNYVPQKLLNQLENGGRLIAILSENGLCNAKKFTRKETMFHSEQLFPCSLPVLPSFKEKNIFSF